jgi:ParB/RepB/Spo0J family partition protein
MKIQIKDIVIGVRQRLELGDIEDLADSIQRLGQIHSIGVDENNLLIWGRRRLAACTHLGWETIEAVKREGLTHEQQQEIELEEDIKRKDRTWQEKCLAVAKLFRIKSRNARAMGEKWNLRMMESFTGQSRATLSNYIYTLADALSVTPKDEVLWNASNYTEALALLRNRAFSEVQAELERRRQISIAYAKQPVAIPVKSIALAGHVQELNTTAPQVLVLPKHVGMTSVTLRDRAMFYNTTYAHLWKQQLTFRCNPKDPTEQFIEGWWFVGGGNISPLYGSYQIEYLERIKTLFPDAVKVVHLFVGSLPPSPDYVRVGLSQGDTKPDIECDAHQLSSYLPFKADLIYADPPYSVEDSEHYDNSMVNRERVLQECALVLEPGGFLVWMDQALPVFNNNDLRLVGGISYIRSTGNRFRVVTIFQKPICQSTKSEPKLLNTNSTNQAEFV